VQVYILLKHSIPNMSAYNVPDRLQQHAERAWLQAKADETQQPLNDFEKDVLRTLSQLNINRVEHKVRLRPGQGMCALVVARCRALRAVCL
jgi:hypothetical protein